MTYTPGPWSLDGCYVTSPSLHPMDCIVFAPNTSDGDLKLIAAAPDLLEALEFMVNSNMTSVTDFKQAARTAIAKAKGEIK